MNERTPAERITFHDAIETMEVDFSHLTMADTAQVDAFFDEVENRLAATGRRWYFLVVYTDCAILPQAWERFAERGKGAFLNDQRLRVAGRRQLSESVIACGLPHIGRGDFQLSQAEMAALQPKVAGLRRFGAASLDLAYVAAGRFDGYWERNLKSWDVAAGILLVREAGGFVSDIDGRDTALETGNIVAGNETIQSALVKILKPLGK